MSVCQNGRLQYCAHCAAYIESSSPVFLLNDAAFCSETHRVLALTATHHGEVASAHAVDAGALFKRSDSPALARTTSFRRLEPMAVGRRAQRICTGVGLVRFMRTWL